MVDSLIFEDIERIEIPVVRGKGENKKEYILQEATETVARVFTNAQAACAKIDDGQFSGVKDPGSLQSFLVSKCLFSVSEDPNGVRVLREVKQGTILGWLARHVKVMFEKAKEISDLEEVGTLGDLLKQKEEIEKQIKKLRDADAKEDEDLAKNELDDIKDGSELPDTTESKNP